ncbi:interleukin 15, like isoform X7 [Pseudorasbora parva]|uniref:interleukin 15, like isoform X7 n=1 Tax=Pseudorasbora parva TaxID=51549 RepID=UPI00351DC473
MTYLVLRGSWIFDMRTDLLHYSMCFTSLFLYLLIMLTRQIKCQPACSKEGAGIVKNITDELIEAVWFLSWQEKEYMLYTPTLADFKQNCSSSTLTCFALELNVLIFEIQSVSTKFQKLFRILNNLSKHKKDKVEPCPDCELYKEEKAKTFFESLQNILQWMNTNC